MTYKLRQPVRTNINQTDINPNNVLVSKADSPKPIVKLADLGASKL